jgi:hypothetical protein
MQFATFRGLFRRHWLRSLGLPFVVACIAAALPWGTIHAEPAVQVPTLEQSEDALFAGRVSEAEAGFALISADPSTAPRERARAGVHWASLAWHIDGNARAALARLQQLAAKGADPCLLNPPLLRVLRESRQWTPLQRTLGRLPTACERASDLPEVQKQAAAGWVALAQQARPPRQAGLMARASRALQDVEPSAALDLDLCRWVLALGLLADDPAMAVDGWRRYYRSGQTAGPAALDAAGIDAQQVFERGLRRGASRAQRLQIADLLARTGFVDALRAFTGQHRLVVPGQADSLSVETYLGLSDEITAITSAFNRKVARAAGHDAQAYDRQLRRSFARAAGRLTGRRVPVGGDGQPDVDGVLRAAFGLWFATGNTNGVASLHAGHVVIDEARTISQFGQQGKIRFFVLDNMLGNGFSTWVSDGESSVGGWAIDGATILQVREPYESGAMRLAALRTGQPGRVDAEAQLSKLSAEDLLAAKQDGKARLPGLGLRLKLQALDQVEAAAAATLPAAAPAAQRLQAFLRLWTQQTTERSIVIHEGRHVLDQAFFRAAPLEGAELERRAKLSELQLGAFPRAAFSTIDDELMGGDTSHGVANSSLMRGLGRWVELHRSEVAGFDAAVPAITQIDRLSDAQIRAAAAALDPRFGAAPIGPQCLPESTAEVCPPTAAQRKREQ